MRNEWFVRSRMLTLVDCRSTPLRLSLSKSSKRLFAVLVVSARLVALAAPCPASTALELLRGNKQK